MVIARIGSGRPQRLFFKTAVAGGCAVVTGIPLVQVGVGCGCGNTVTSGAENKAVPCRYRCGKTITQPLCVRLNILAVFPVDRTVEICSVRKRKRHVPGAYRFFYKKRTVQTVEASPGNV